MQKLTNRREPWTIRPIGAGDQKTAKHLLIEGFPKRSPIFWDKAIDRLQHLGCNAAAGVPLGYLMLDRVSPVGVLLTPASLRGSTESVRTIVNLSSWYIRPDHRWRAGIMLRAILHMHKATFTDLTPSDEVRRMLRAFDFRQISGGVSAHILPTAALEPAKEGVVREADYWPALIADDIRDLLDAHRSIGCLAAILEADGRSHLLMVKQRRLRGLPAATLVYSSSNTALARHFPVFARFLVRRGIFILITDIEAVPGRRAQMTRPYLKFAKQHKDCVPNHQSTDYLGSELCILDL